MKRQRRSTMMSDVRQLVAAGEGLSQSNEDGVTLVKMAPDVLWKLFSMILVLVSQCYLLYYSEAAHSLCQWIQGGGVCAAGERGRS